MFEDITMCIFQIFKYQISSTSQDIVDPIFFIDETTLSIKPFKSVTALHAEISDKKEA